MERDEAEKLYGIIFEDNGYIFDPTYNRRFPSLGEWADFSVQQDEMEYEEDIGRDYQQPWD